LGKHGKQRLIEMPPGTGEKTPAWVGRVYKNNIGKNRKNTNGNTC